MDRHKKIFVLLVGFSLLLGACLNLKQPSSKIDFYTLEYDPPQISGLNPLPAVIRIERFSVGPIYNTNRIIYRDQSFKREAYVYHKWRTDPGNLVTYLLSRDIQKSGLFKAALSHNSGFLSCYVLEGSVDEFFESDIGKTWKAVLSLSITLVAENESNIGKRILFQKNYHAEEECMQKNPRALAEAMSRAMAKVSQEVIIDVYYYLAPIYQ